MKLADLRPCDGCGGSINPVFYRVEIEQHVIDQARAQQHVGMVQFFGGNAGLAGVFTDDARATTPAQRATLLLCTECFSLPSAAMAIAWQKRSEPTREALEAEQRLKERLAAKRAAGGGA